MANFFEAWTGMTAEQVVKSAHSYRATTVQATSSGVGVVGIFGSDEGSLLRIGVDRGGTTVSEGPKPTVRVSLLLKIADKPMGVYQATGLRSDDKIYAVGSNGRRYALALPIPVTQVTGTAANVMQAWANSLRADRSYTPTEESLCPYATPYLALTKNGLTAVTLPDALVGGPMSAVHGLSVHTTGGGGNRDEYQTAINGCVATWKHNYEQSGFIAAAHFAIASNGMLIQIVPTDRIAWAQGSPADYSWISVEVDNDGTSAMPLAAVNAVRVLFRWVCRTYGVPHRLAPGMLYANKSSVLWKKNQDEATTSACAAGGASTTREQFTAIFGRGLSCHYWLDARNLKPCPGLGIMAQLAQIANQ